MRPHRSFSFRHHILVNLCLGTLLALPAAAHHRQTAPLTRLTDVGDTPAPHQTNLATNFGVAVGTPAGQVASIIHPDQHQREYISTPIGAGTDDRHTTIAKNRRSVLWDATVPGLPGRQIFRWTSDNIVTQLTADPVGTCERPSIDGRGRTAVFECTGDIAGTGTAATRRIIRWSNGTFTQVSSGHGVSRNASLNLSGRKTAYESTDDPVDGHDTGVAQIWLSDSLTGPTRRITNGDSASRHPALTDNARLVAFESTADLVGDNHDTGVSRIYVYDTTENTLGRLTDDPGGCTDPSIVRIGTEFYVGFVCSGEARRYGVHNDEYLHLPTPAGSTSSAVLTFSRHFMLLSTTANLLTPGQTTANSNLYLWNLYREAATPLPAAPLWTPFRSID
jgi:hypothetical protein